MVSGSAALPEPVLSEWESITGTLESYITLACVFQSCSCICLILFMEREFFSV